MRHTFLLPDLLSMDSGLSDYILRDLIDFVTLNMLEKTGRP